jgi:hypothetical protein
VVPGMVFPTSVVTNDDGPPPVIYLVFAY